MFLRKTYLESRLALPDTGEHTTDIAMREPITNLWLEFRATNGATNNQANLLADCVSAIEVIDGSEVVFSLDGYEALALGAYLGEELNNQMISEVGGHTQNLAVPIYFGRYIGDPDYAFDPGHFVNPQVRVKWNLAAIRAVGITGFVSGTLRLTVLANVMEAAAVPKGYMMSKEIYSYVPAVGIEYIDLPTDYPYRGLLFRDWMATKSVYGLVSALKMHCDQERVIPFNMRMTDILRYQTLRRPRFQYLHWFHEQDADTLYHILKHEECATFNVPIVADAFAAYDTVGIGEGVLHLSAAGAVRNVDTEFVSCCNGYAPFGCIYIPFNVEDTPVEYFPAPEFRSVRLEATGGAAGGNAYACLIQEHPY